MKTLEQIKEIPVYGNHFHDMPIFEAVDELVLSSDASIEDKAEALRYMGDVVMGCGRTEWMSDKDLVEEAIEYINRGRGN